MRIVHPGKIEKKAVSGQILAWMLVFLLGIILIWGHVRYYELTLENEARQEELHQLQLELAQRKKERQQTYLNLEAAAEELGLYLPQPEEYIVVHVQDTEAP